MPKKIKKTELIEPTIAQVEDNPDLIRDLSTNAIINNSDRAYEARLNQIEKGNELENLKKDVAEIKELLKEIASK
jgi:hypothetical protein